MEPEPGIPARGDEWVLSPEKVRRLVQGELPTLLAMLIVFLAVNAARTVVSYKALGFGAGSFQVGLIAAAYSVLPFVLGIPLGMSIDRIGPTPFLVLSASLAVISSLLLLSAPTLLVLALGQAFLGMSHTTMAISVQSRAATFGAEAGRDRRFAHVAVIAATGQFVGPLIAAWTIAHAGISNSGLPDTSSTFAVASLIALLGVGASALVWLRSPERGATSARRVTTQPRFREVLFRPGVMRVLSASLAALAATDLMIAYLPVIAQERGFAATFVSVLLSLAAGAGLASRVIVVPLLSVVKGRTILLGGLMLAALGAGGIMIAHRSWAFAIAIGAVGLGVGVAAPIVGSWMAGSAPIGERGTSLALRMTTNRLGQVLIPISFGALATLFGSVSIFAAIAVMLVASVRGLRKVILEA